MIAGRSPEPDPYERARLDMVQWQLERRGIRHAGVLAAFRAVPRHRFVPGGREDEAYEDHPVQLESGQTVSQPYIVARMLELLDLARGAKVLEIGTGSGYLTALLVAMGADVWSVERFEGLAERARARLEELGYRARVLTADGTRGWPAGAPYDGVIVSAAARFIPQAYMDQVRPGGRIVIPVGGRHEQEIVLAERTPEGWKTTRHGACVFVPLVGEEGWPTDETLGQF